MMFGKKRTPEEDVMSLKEQRAMLGDRLSFAASEAYKLLRTNLTFALPDEQRCRVVGITSASRGEGKSTTSINLAYTIAETGKRVLLVEADMRRPNLARRLAIDPAPGLSNLLPGDMAQIGGQHPGPVGRHGAPCPQIGVVDGLPAVFPVRQDVEGDGRQIPAILPVRLADGLLIPLPVQGHDVAVLHGDILLSSCFCLSSRQKIPAVSRKRGKIFVCCLYYAAGSGARQDKCAERACPNGPQAV